METKMYISSKRNFERLAVRILSLRVFCNRPRYQDSKSDLPRGFALVWPCLIAPAPVCHERRRISILSRQAYRSVRGTAEANKISHSIGFERPGHPGQTAMARARDFYD